MIAFRAVFFAALVANAESSQKQDGRSLRNTDDSSAATSTPTSLLVDYLYTYGAPSVTVGSHQSNPNNACIPGIRTYTEDMTSQATECSWYQIFCKEESGTRIINVDFASQVNAKDGYLHPKMNVLVLRSVDGVVESAFRPCNDGTYEETSQYWPGPDEPSEMMTGSHIHSLDEHYESRLLQASSSLSYPLTDFVSAARE
jgi:hypothetical protein